MWVRVLKKEGGDTEDLGHFNVPGELPSVGDTFTQGGRGPYEVVARTFVYDKEEGDPNPEDVVLTVKEVKPSQVAVFLSKRNRD
jgi:hypothetical protein